MIKKVFRNNKEKTDTKEVYLKLSQLTNTNKMTDILNPGESFIISNEEAKGIQ